MNRCRLLIAVLLTVGAASLLGYEPVEPPDDFEMPPPKSPEASRRSIEAPDGMRVELVAAEPLVVDPIAFDWDGRGRLWVVEMRDYPRGMDGQGEPGGRVRILTDPNGDGRYEQATTFLDGLAFPTGIMSWRDGALVLVPPKLLYAEDTDGDGKADRRRTLYTGFATANQQHRANGLRWGLGNWVYIANGLGGGGRITSEKTGRTVQMRGHDLRIRPGSGALEPASGATQYIRNRDGWGTWFGSSNTEPSWQYLLPHRYTRRNGRIGHPRPWQPVPRKPGAARVYPASETLVRFNNPKHANRFTSACSLMVYRDDRLGEEAAGDTFVCEPVHNLIHRERRQRKGLRYRSRRIDSEQQSEFLAARDKWFRPVMARTGPDGALWVADMYRFVTEHPEWIPEAWQKAIDLRAGSDRGRIYRVAPEDGDAQPMPTLHGLSADELVDRLGRRNGWVRDRAHQMLLWRDATSAAAPLNTLVRNAESPRTRLQSLAALDGLGELGPTLLGAAMNDAHWAVRRHAVRLSEPLLADHPPLQRAVLDRADDGDAMVRQQVAFSLGAWDAPQAGRALGRLLRRDRGHRYIVAAALSSASARPGAALSAALSGERPVGGEIASKLVATALGAGDREPIRKLVARMLEDEPSNAARLNRLAEVLDAADAHGSLGEVLGDELAGQLAALRERAAELAKDAQQEPAIRRAAVRLLGRGAADRKRDAAVLGDLLRPRIPLPVQKAAAERLSAMATPAAAKSIVEALPAAGPKVRNELVAALLSRRAWTARLLDELERNPQLTNVLEASHRRRLLDHEAKPIRRRAEQLLNAGSNADRGKLVRRYAQKMQDATGDPERGARLFQKHCAVCHRHGGLGNRIGPDLSGLNDQSTARLLRATLDPNRAVASRYQRYTVRLKDGRTLVGMIDSESGGSITLRTFAGQTHQIPRSRIRSVRTTGRSLMPVGFEQAFSAEDLADLFAFIRNPKQGGAASE